MNSFKWLLAVLLVLIPLNVLADRGGEGTGAQPISSGGMLSRPPAMDWACVGGTLGMLSPQSSAGAALAASEWFGVQYATVGTVSHVDEGVSAFASRVYLTITSAGAGSGGFADVFSGSGVTGIGVALRAQGFWLTQTFAMGNNVASHIGFFGVGVQGSITNNDPDAVAGRNNSIAMYFRTGDATNANWRLMYRAASSAAQTTFDLGANCVRSTANVLQLIIHCPPSGLDNACYVRVRNVSAGADCLANGGTAGGWARISGANLPSTTAEMVIENYLQDGTAGGTGTAPIVNVFENRICRNLVNILRD